MGTYYKRAIGAIIVLMLVLAIAALSLPASGQDCGYPGCAHYLPTRTPTPFVSPLAAPDRPVRGIYLPFMTR